MNPHVIVSNGFFKFHLAVAAAEAQRRGTLVSFLTGAYPPAWLQRLLQSAPLRRWPRAGRLLGRREAVPDSLVHSFVLPEFLAQLTAPLKMDFDSTLNRYALHSYARCAVAQVRQAAMQGANLYHYRAGFGHESVREAKRLGMVTLCDHSIVHPAALQPLIDTRGSLSAIAADNAIAPGWSDVLQDIEQADAVLVNSDFVRQTFLDRGWPPEKVRTIYLGVDDAFLQHVPAHAPPKLDAPMRLLFAGHFNQRKGAEILVQALANLDHVNWSLEIAAGVDPELRQKYHGFFADPRVQESGFVSRTELARKMADAEVFIFPSFAEGSARVVFEALAAGCYVITTPNSGSIVEDGVHGRLLTSGDAGAFREAIAQAGENRGRVFETGQRNAALIRDQYKQEAYGRKLHALYHELLQSRDVGRAQ